MPFGGLFHIAPHLGGQKPQFRFVNRRFQAKLEKLKNVRIIKTTAPIPIKFCTVIKTTKCPLWVVPTHALQIQYGGRSKTPRIASFRGGSRLHLIHGLLQAITSQKTDNENSIVIWSLLPMGGLVVRLVISVSVSVNNTSRRFEPRVSKFSS